MASKRLNNDALAVEDAEFEEKAFDNKPLEADLVDDGQPLGVKQLTHPGHGEAINSDLRLPRRGYTAPPSTKPLLRALSGHRDLPSLLELRARRFNSGLFYLNNRDDLRDVGQPAASDMSEEKLSPPQSDPNVLVFSGPDDPLSPQNWSLGFKIWQTGLLAITTLVVTFASSVFSSATASLERVFDVGQVVATLSTSLFVLGYAVGPLIWAPMSEFLGRRNPLLLAYFCFAIFQIPVAVAQNFQTVAICRFLGGTFASGPLAIVGGAFSDFWSPEARGGAIAIFALAVFAGPAIGPIIGSFVTQSYLGWRWTAWITCIWAFLMFALCFLFLEESFAPVILQRRAKKLRYKTKNWAMRSQLDEREFEPGQILTVYVTRPLKMLSLEPILLLLSLYTAFIYGILYLLFGAVPYEFQVLRGWAPGPASLVFIAVFLGACLGAAIIYAFSPRYARKLHEAKAISLPEERCIPMFIGALMFPTGIFLMSWTTVEYVESYWPSLVGLFLLSTGVVLVFLQAINYIVDVYLYMANSAIAANTMLRSFFGASFPLFTIQMYRGLGFQYAGTLLGGLAVLMIPIPMLFFYFGKSLRSKSRYAPNLSKMGPPR